MNAFETAPAAATALSSRFPLVLGGNVFGWTADREATFAVLDRFLAAGGTHIDTSDSYMAAIPGLRGGESETLIGEWMASRGSRNEVVIATKVGSLQPHIGLSRQSITRAVEDSLRRLRTDRIDLYWAHRDDESVPQEETVGAFDSLVRAGKITHVGVSNFRGERLKAIIETARALGGAPIDAVQPEYNLMERDGFEADQLPVLELTGIRAWTYHSLAAGFLTGKYRAGAPSDQTARSSRALRYADHRGNRVLDALMTVAGSDSHRTLASVALAWLAARPGVMAPIASARNVGQLDALLPVATTALTPDEFDLLTRASEHIESGAEHKEGRSWTR